MNTITQYLWQATCQPYTTVRIADTIIKDNDTIHWYFFSQKQSKILRKKKQNSCPTMIIEEYQKKCTSRFDALQVGIMCVFAPFQRKIISGSQLIDKVYDDKSSFVFVNLSSLQSPSLFILQINESQKNIVPFSKKYQLVQQTNYKILSFLNDLQLMIDSATLRKSNKIVQGKIIVAISAGKVYLVWADIFKVNNDYYHLSYEYHEEEKILKTKKVQQEIDYYCQSCDGKVQKENRKQINYEGIIVIKTMRKKSKYGLNPHKMYTVCEKCYELLFVKNYEDEIQ